MQPKMQADLVLNALLMAVWKRKPKNEVLVHSDQGVQYTSGDWQNFLKEHNLVCSMSRRGNCYDNAVAESFFQLLKRERIKRKTYKDREAARLDIFDYIKCSIIQSVVMAIMMTCHRSNLRGSTSTSLRVPIKTGSIHCWSR